MARKKRDKGKYKQQEAYKARKYSDFNASWQQGTYYGGGE